MAGIVAAELGVSLRVTSGPAIERAGDLAALLTNLDEGEVLFIDEIHRLSRVVEEVLYPAMEDFQLDIVIGKGPAARSLRLDLPHFTLVGATTRTGLITSPLRDRFGFVARLDFYNVDDLTTIVTRTAHILGVALDADVAAATVGRSRDRSWAAWAAPCTDRNLSRSGPCSSGRPVVGALFRGTHLRPGSVCDLWRVGRLTRPNAGVADLRRGAQQGKGLVLHPAVEQPLVFLGEPPIESPGGLVAAQDRPMERLRPIGGSLASHPAQQPAAQAPIARPAFDIKIA